MTTSQAPICYCPLCGKPEHGSAACGPVSGALQVTGVVSLEIPTQPIEAPLAARLARAKKPCDFLAISNVDGTPMEVVCVGGKLMVNGQLGGAHDVCQGTGLVYVLPDIVRIPCPHAKYLANDSRWCWPCKVSCSQGCNSLGYIPSASLEDWLEALWSIGYIVSYWSKDLINIQQVNGIIYIINWRLGKSLEALQRALAAALEEEGVKLEVTHEQH